MKKIIAFDILKSIRILELHIFGTLRIYFKDFDSIFDNFYTFWTRLICIVKEDLIWVQAWVEVVAH
jgi:hypothetical protein